MKIVLISPNTVTTPYPVYPLGMGVIAAALKHARHEVVMFDLLTMRMSIDDWREALCRENPALAGISIRNLDNLNMLNEKRHTGIIAELVRCVHEELSVPVVLGGSGYSLLPERLLAETGADYGIVGEAECLIVKLVASLENGNKPSRGTILRGLTHIEGPSLHGAYYASSLLKSYLKAGSIAPVQTKRGCNLRCSYCAYPVLEGGEFRSRPAGDVVDDIEELVKRHNVPYVFFTDSVFK